MVIWLIGLSGAGKSTLANAVVECVRAMGRPVVLLDGDAVREMFGNDLGHSIDDRRTNAQRICQLSKFIESQGIAVVCAILSIFPESRAWNREHLSRYFEVFIDTPIEHLVHRDSKGLYARYQRGEIHGVAGMDMPFPPPNQADLVIHNTGSRDELLAHAQALAALVAGDVE